MKLLSLTAILGVASVVFLSASPVHGWNALTAGVLREVNEMEIKVIGLKDSFDQYLAGDCSQTQTAYTAIAELIQAIEDTARQIRSAGRGLQGEDVAKIGLTLDRTAGVIREVVDKLIWNRQRLVQSNAAWIPSKALPILQKEYEFFKLVLLSATPLKRRDQIERPSSWIVNELVRGVVAFQDDGCACYNPQGGASVSGYGVGIQIIIRVAISINIQRRDLELRSLPASNLL